ncbi:MAG: hypothetical protein ACEPOW_13700 [Bacteroidales bacterium]
MIEKINNAIEERGIKKCWIAKKIGIGSPTLSDWLNKKKVLPLERENQLMLLLNLERD